MDCRVNQVLAVIAGDLGVPAEAVTVEDGAVFYDAGKGLRCACQVGTAHWHECWAKAETDALMGHLRGNFSR
jgi:hypothetical protein